MKKHNFFAGPAILPQEVLEKTAAAINNFSDMGLSLLEISHRSTQFVNVIETSVNLVKELLDLDDSYKVLFLTGGASTQFFMTAMNILGENETASYVNTGTWSTKAIKEAKRFGNIIEIASSKDKNFNYIPKDFSIPENSKFLHLTSNNTIFGTQFHSFPETNVPIICDMSSDIFSRPIDSKKFGVIYAGAQKNMGPAGTTLVIVREDMLNTIERDIPTMLDYNTHIKKDSAFNTPPVLPIYVSMLTMQWVKKNGGTKAMAERNHQKATLLYNEIDRNSMFVGTANKEDRSLMNITFVLKDNSLEKAFLDATLDAGCMGLKGHRSVGGFRASTYNALPVESVQVLVDVMKNFEQKFG